MNKDLEIYRLKKQILHLLSRKSHSSMLCGTSALQIDLMYYKNNFFIVTSAEEKLE